MPRPLPDSVHFRFVLPFRLLGLLLLAPCLGGCTNSPEPQSFHEPTAAELAQIQAKTLDSIQHDPTLSSAQKAERIRAMTNPPPP